MTETRDIDELIGKFSGVLLKDDPNVAATKIQKVFRGHSVRKHRLPIIMYIIQRRLINCPTIFSKANADGRINSCADEEHIVQILRDMLGNCIRVPKSRMWYDVLVYDNRRKWIPINIKTTTMKTSDNVGNLAMCVYAYTNEKLNLRQSATYQNGEMSRILFEKIKKKELNHGSKDYYFLVLDKNDPKNVGVNSLRGLTVLTPNLNNLPFQVQWSKNTKFRFKPISEVVRLFIKSVKTPPDTWRETFLTNMRSL
jgi:hypothetical protein